MHIRLLVFSAFLFCFVRIFAGDYALVVGISGYPDFPSGEELKYADKDAEEFAKFLRTSAGGGLPEKNVKVVFDKAANLEGIQDGIDWLNKQAEADSGGRIFVFFSGHALPDDKGQVYLIPYGVPKNKPSHGIRIDNFFQSVRELPAKESFLFLDACHSAAALNSRGAKGERSTAEVIREAWRTESENHKGSLALAFFSASSNQESFEHEKAGGGHGIFTYFVLEGLKGKADRAEKGKADGIVTSGELYKYLLDEVEAFSNQYIGSTQTPTKSPEWDPDIMLAAVTLQENSEKEFLMTAPSRPKKLDAELKAETVIRSVDVKKAATSKEPPPTAKRVVRELWDSLVTLGRHRRIPADENIVLLLPPFLKRYEDAPKRMVAVVKAEWDQLQKFPMLPRPIDWKEEGSEAEGSITTHKFRAVYRTADIVWPDGRRITGPNGEDVLRMPDGTVVYPIPDLRVEVDLGEDNEPRAIRFDNEWTPKIVARQSR